jgi:hypothetical protein
MSNLKKHFEKEFKILQNEYEEPIVLHFKEPLMQIIDIFSKQGHSGGSAPFYAEAISESIKNLLMLKPLSPLTGKDEEWQDVTNFYDQNEDERSPVYQNIRYSSVFKKNDKAYCIGVIIWQNIDDEYDSFTGSVEGISSSVTIEQFPFIPKTFYIYVERVDGPCPITKHYSMGENNSKYHYRIIDKNQVTLVYDYYKGKVK